MRRYVGENLFSLIYVLLVTAFIAGVAFGQSWVLP